jgi:hypothetical protein
MEIKLNTRTEYDKGVAFIHPSHKAVQHWRFEANQAHEAHFADAVMRLAGNNGMSVNDVQHLFPAMLRMLKSNIQWSK